MNADFRVDCVLLGGDDFNIVVDGRDYLFEMHPYCGPVPKNKLNGKERELGPKHPFWAAVDFWNEQGREVDENGRCRWRTTPTWQEKILARSVEIGPGLYIVPPNSEDE